MLEVITTYINDQYGSRRGLLNYWQSGLQFQLGRFTRYKKIDWSRVQNLVFVCHGNICRSPLAEAMAEQCHNLSAESFGLDCCDGAAADPRAISFADSMRIDLTQHSSRHINNYQPSVSDLVVVMEPGHLLQLPRNIPGVAQVTLIGLWMLRPWPYVHDPYGSSEKHFESCEQAIVSGVEGISKQWQSS